MSKVKLYGLDIAVRDLGKTIKISKDESSNNPHKHSTIRIDILNKDGNVVNGLSEENLIRGLIVCSNYYLPESEQLEDIKKYKSSLEKCIKNGAYLKIQKIGDKDCKMHLAINVNGKNKYNFYGLSVKELIKNTEEIKSIVKNEL